MRKLLPGLMAMSSLQSTGCLRILRYSTHLAVCCSEGLIAIANAWNRYFWAAFGLYMKCERLTGVALKTCCVRDCELGVGCRVMMGMGREEGS